MLKSEVLDFIKIKLEKDIYSPIKNVFCEDVLLREETISPQKEFKSDLYVDKIINQIKDHYNVKS